MVAWNIASFINLFYTKILASHWFIFNSFFSPDYEINKQICQLNSEISEALFKFLLHNYEFLEIILIILYQQKKTFLQFLQKHID